MVKIKIIDSYGIGYITGKEYEVTPAEAKKLVDEKKAEVVGSPLVETADVKTSKAEKAVSRK